MLISTGTTKNVDSPNGNDQEESKEENNAADQNPASGFYSVVPPPNNVGIAILPKEADEELAGRILECTGITRLKELELDVKNSISKRSQITLKKAFNLTNDEIYNCLTRSQLRSLCKQCTYCGTSPNSKTISKENKKLSENGNTRELASRVLTYFHKMKQQQAIQSPREFNWGDSGWTNAEDARLIEIICDPNYRSLIKYIYTSGRRTILDATSGRPQRAVWNLVISCLYNNFEEYKPAMRFDASDLTMAPCNPNNTAIPRRSGDLLKTRFAHMRSRFTTLVSSWKQSGCNDPDTVSSYVDIASSCEKKRVIELSALYMFKLWVEHQDDSHLNSMLRPNPDEMLVDTQDPMGITVNSSRAKKGAKMGIIVDSSRVKKGAKKDDNAPTRRSPISWESNDKELLDITRSLVKPSDAEEKAFAAVKIQADSASLLNYFEIRDRLRKDKAGAKKSCKKAYAAMVCAVDPVQKKVLEKRHNKKRKFLENTISNIKRNGEMIASLQGLEYDDQAEYSSSGSEE